jgi:hypothetical protein
VKKVEQDQSIITAVCIELDTPPVFFVRKKKSRSTYSTVHSNPF